MGFFAYYTEWGEIVTGHSFHGGKDLGTLPDGTWIGCESQLNMLAYMAEQQEALIDRIPLHDPNKRFMRRIKPEFPGTLNLGMNVNKVIASRRL